MGEVTGIPEPMVAAALGSYRVWATVGGTAQSQFFAQNRGSAS